MVALYQYRQSEKLLVYSDRYLSAMTSSYTQNRYKVVTSDSDYITVPCYSAFRMQ